MLDVERSILAIFSRSLLLALMVRQVVVTVVDPNFRERPITRLIGKQERRDPGRVSLKRERRSGRT